MTSGGPRGYDGEYVADDQVERAMHKLVRACLEQPKPSKRLVRQLNRVLSLIGHPERDRTVEEAA